jgi:hypothetical protein
VDKDPNRAIALFWAAINAGDRVDSALKDMAIVMKQQNRPEEAIEAIKSLRYRCSDHAQESLDNVLLDLYKVWRCSKLFRVRLGFWSEAFMAELGAVIQLHLSMSSLPMGDNAAVLTAMQSKSELSMEARPGAAFSAPRNPKP